MDTKIRYLNWFLLHHFAYDDAQKENWNFVNSTDANRSTYYGNSKDHFRPLNPSTIGIGF